MLILTLFSFFNVFIKNITFISKIKVQKKIHLVFLYFKNIENKQRAIDMYHVSCNNEMMRIEV